MLERNCKARYLPFDRKKGGKYHEWKFLRNERRVIEERLQQIIRGQEQGALRQRIGPRHSGGFQL